MDPNKLQLLLTQPEQPALEFKRELYRIDDPDGQIRRHHRDEFIKDILSLANGSSLTAGETAYLIIGADDNQTAEGKRQLHDIGDCNWTPIKLLNIINQACDPPLEDIVCEQIALEDKRILAITIPPTPHLYETNKTLNTVSQTYSRYVVFVRHNEGVTLASAKERDAIQKLKRIRFDERRRVAAMPFGAATGALVGSIFASAIEGTIKPDHPVNVTNGIAGGIVGALIGALMGSNYASLMYIRSTWYRIPPQRRPIVLTVAGVGSFLAGFATKKLLTYRRKA